MRATTTWAQCVNFFKNTAKSTVFIAFANSAASIGNAQTTDQIAPTPPTGLSANAASCGQVDLSWGASTDDVGGSGLKAYIVWRNNNGVNTVAAIGSTRTTFSDTNYVRSSETLNYYVVAQDNAGNNSLSSNVVTVVTPACSTSLGEQVVDNAYIEPLGKTIATYGTRSAVVYQKLNTYSLRDTWLYISDSDTGQTSRFLLHSSPGYDQIETDYLLTTATELWTLSSDGGSGGKLLVSQYTLNGTPPASATLLSTKSIGDSSSYAQSMIRLQSGGLAVAWDEANFSTASDLSTGYAYRSPTGNWTVKFPITIPNSGFGGNILMSTMIMAQHPADNSIWAFVKRDSFTNISALHFSEAANDFVLDWVNPGFITQSADGNNGPEGEFPSLAATADPTRNAILLAYQSRQDQIVFIDPLYGNLSNNTFLKQAQTSIAQINADASKNFIPFQTYMERCMQFGMSVLSDGTIWLTYQPINAQTLTWNGVYASKYQNGIWGNPMFAGFNYKNYNIANGERAPGILNYRTDQPQVAFMTPDQKIHTFDLSNLNPAPADATAPATAIISPVSGAIVSGTVSVSASASDNVGVTSVQLLVDGLVVGSATSTYNFSWNTTTVPNGSHVLQAQAFDAAGNVGLSAPVTLTVSNSTASSLKVVVTSPANGASVPRNQKVTVAASATDNSKVTRMDFYINNNLLGTVTTAPYNYPWKVPAKHGALYNVQAKAYDALGNNAAQTITVIAQ
jgi:Bacterial Ig domain